MYESSPRPIEGKPIEEVLPAAIEATATSEPDERAGRGGGRHEPGEREMARTGQYGMRVMAAGSPVLKGPMLSMLIAFGSVVVVLILLAVVLF